MKTAEETAGFIRRRLHELAPLKPQERQAMIGAEIQRMWQGVSPLARQELIEQIEPFFPAGEGQSKIQVASEASAPTKLGLDDLIELLKQETEARPESEHSSIRSRIESAMGWRPVPADPSITVESLIIALEKVKWRALSDPDPVLNPGIKSFTKSSIVNLPGFIAKLRPPNGGVAEFLRNRLPLETRNMLLAHRGTENDLKRVSDRLESELPSIIEGKPIDEALRSAGVNLSGESRFLLEQQSRTERQAIRLNQALLEDAFPEEVKFETTERELVEKIVSSLRGMAVRSVHVDTALQLAAAVLMEIGCLEQFGRKVLHGLNQRVFDEVHGRIVEEDNALEALVARLVQRGEASGFSVELRRRTGIIECLLYWYGFAPAQAAKLLAEMNPDNFVVRQKVRFMSGEAVDYEASWNKLRERYLNLLTDLGGAPGRDIDENKLKLALNKSVEQRVTTQLADAYSWRLREEDQG